MYPRMFLKLRNFKMAVVFSWFTSRAAYFKYDITTKVFSSCFLPHGTFSPMYIKWILIYIYIFFLVMYDTLAGPVFWSQGQQTGKISCFPGMSAVMHNIMLSLWSVNYMFWSWGEGEFRELFQLSARKIRKQAQKIVLPFAFFLPHPKPKLNEKFKVGGKRSSPLQDSSHCMLRLSEIRNTYFGKYILKLEYQYDFFRCVYVWKWYPCTSHFCWLCQFCFKQKSDITFFVTYLSINRENIMEKLFWEMVMKIGF